MHQLCRFPDLEYLHSVTQGLVISQLDYCNAYYVGLTLKSVWKLQLIQKVATWEVLVAPTVAHVTPLFWKLHWLPVCFLIKFKGLVITFKDLHRMGPGYLTNHLTLIRLDWPTHEDACCGSYQSRNFIWQSRAQQKSPFSWPEFTSSKRRAFCGMSSGTLCSWRWICTHPFALLKIEDQLCQQAWALWGNGIPEVINGLDRPLPPWVYFAPFLVNWSIEF